jgi:hypothetical protein
MNLPYLFCQEFDRNPLNCSTKFHSSAFTLKFPSFHFPFMREYISSTGTIIRLGENAHENDSLVKTSHQDFVWCHLENQPSPHAVIQDPNPDTASLNEALQLVKYFSRGRHAQQARMIVSKVRDLVRVDRTRPGLVQITRAPQKKSTRTDIPTLRSLGVIPVAN